MKRTLLVILAFVVLFYGSLAYAEIMPDFILKWGSGGGGEGQFSSPAGVCVDSQGDVYVADFGNQRIQKFTSTGQFILKWGSPGSGDGQLSGPFGVGVDSQDNVYVADRGNDRIQKFTSTGQFILKWGSYGSGDGQFSQPNGIAVDALGNVYVVELQNHRIQKFTSTGQFILKWGSPGSGDGQFSQPHGIVVDALDNAYVADFGNCRIQKFTSTGQFILKWGSPGSGDGQFSSPTGVCVDSEDNVYVADYGNHRIQKFTSTGQLILKWGSPGPGDGQFWYPAGVSFDSQDNVYVAEFGNHRVQKFSFSPYEPHYLAVADVGNDEGRQVRINFLKASRDRAGSPSPILQYEAYRRIDSLFSLANQNSVSTEVQGQPLHPSAMLKGWEFVGAIPAHCEDEYNMVVPTLADSTEDGGIYWTAFFIRATTTYPWIFYDSAPDSGYSVDNLAPSAPLNFHITFDGFLVWDPSPEKDLKFYTVYASQHEHFDGAAVLFGKTTNTTLDASQGTYLYYYLTAEDFGGNESDPAMTFLGPVPVFLSRFTAERQQFNVVISWQVSAPYVSGAAFHVYRETDNGREKLTTEPLAGQTSYEFTDKNAPIGQVSYWLQNVGGNESNWQGPITVSAMTGIPLTLSCVPNPFNPSTTIRYTVPVTDIVRLRAYDVSGRLVRVLVDEQKPGGEQTAVWDGRDLRGQQVSSGVYFVRLESGGEVQTRKIVLMK